VAAGTIVKRLHRGGYRATELAPTSPWYCSALSSGYPLQIHNEERGKSDNVRISSWSLDYGWHANMHTILLSITVVFPMEGQVTRHAGFLRYPSRSEHTLFLRSDVQNISDLFDLEACPASLIWPSSGNTTVLVRCSCMASSADSPCRALT
jgi:hypothetical protein